jgi:glycosyltransferase involved in cell wall biosynthesis
MSSGSPLHVIHLGPDPRTIGGIQAVLRVVREHSVGADRITIAPTWSGRSQSRNALLVAQAARLILAAERGAIVHVHLSNRGAYLRDPPLMQLARRRRLRVVVSVHGDDFPSFARAHPRIVRSALSPASHITCLSADAQAAATETLGTDRVTVVANPIAVDRAAPPADRTEPVILFAGVVGLRKGVDVLVDAWRELLGQGVDGRCRIVGPIHDFQPPAVERLTVEGQVEPGKIRPLIHSARVVALPSRSEGMPMILAEALACGRPFVATPVGGIPSLAHASDMLVPVGDPGALAAALRRYLDDPAAAALTGRRGKQFCLETRSPEVVGAQLRAIYAGA